MLKPLRALLLEDNPDDAELVLYALRQAGFEVQWRRVETEADYRASLSKDYEIILADYSLPTFNAVRALDVLITEGVDVPFIIISGSISEELAVESMKRGATDYLLKDRLSRLGQAVENALRERRLRAEKTEAERALRQSEILFRTIFNESLDILLLVDSSGVIQAVNPAVERILQYRPAQVVGQHFSIFFPAAPQQTFDDIQTTLNAAGSVFLSQPFQRLDGSICPMDLTATMLSGDDASILITLRDVSERQQAEEAMRAAELLHVELEKEKELGELKTRFISMVSHEYRNPLTTILTSSDILRLFAQRLTEEQRERHLERIQESVRNMVQLVDQVLTTARFDSNRVEVHPKPIDLVEFCSNLMDEIRQNAGETHQFSFQSDGEESILLLDTALLRQILSNLLTNAVKYSPRGGTVTLHVRWEANTVTVSVADQGIGIPAEDQKHLFGVFHRAANAGEIPGTGLGLNIVKKAVEKLGGSITFQSVVNKGTTFFVTLPRL